VHNVTPEQKHENHYSDEIINRDKRVIIELSGSIPLHTSQIGGNEK